MLVVGALTNDTTLRVEPLIAVDPDRARIVGTVAEAVKARAGPGNAMMASTDRQVLRQGMNEVILRLSRTDKRCAVGSRTAVMSWIFPGHNVQYVASA